MEKDQARQIMSALSQETRLAIYEALIAVGDEGLPAGQLARITGAAPNTISAHMTIMSAAGLVHHKREGRSVIYFADQSAIRGLVELLGGLTS